MSETSIKDQGYTSPNFLANLFKKPLYSPISLTSISSTNDETLSTSKENCSSSLFEPSHSVLKARNQNRMYCSLSMIDDEKIQSKKYRIFFKTLLFGRFAEYEINELWNKLQSSISNPFEFDKLIETTKAKREAEIQAENVSQPMLSTKIDVQDSKISSKGKSVSKKISQELSLVRYWSIPKKQKQQIKKKTQSKLTLYQRQIIEKEVSSIKAIISKNQISIRKKTQ